MNVLVKDLKEPLRNAWEMSEKGFNRLKAEVPGRYVEVQKVHKEEEKTLIIKKNKITVKEVEANGLPKKAIKKNSKK